MLTAIDELACTDWVGLEARDCYGEALGTIVEVLRDRSTGIPEWLLIEEAGSTRLAPVPRALLTGRKVRVAASAEAVRSAPQLKPGADLDLDSKQFAAEHYELELDTEHSWSGQLRAPARMPEPAVPGPVRELGERRRAQIVGRLAAAHAMEQASLKLLAAMRRRAQDEELVHDIALHHRATRAHAERVRERLDALGSPRARPLEWLARTWAYAKSRLGRATGEHHDVRSAYEFEQREIAAYEQLERLASAAGDSRTAQACRANRLDEVAMAATLLNSRLWRDGTSPEPQIAPRG